MISCICQASEISGYPEIPWQEEKIRKVIYSMLVSLDGYIEDPHGSIEFTIPDEELHLHFNEMDRTVDTYLYGRRIYEIMVSFWPTAEDDPANPEYIKQYARQWKQKDKLVFSRTLFSVDQDSRLFKGDLAAEIRRMKSQPGLDMSVGGANLAASFIELDLIDEYHLYFIPVLLGGGKPMFPRLEAERHLKLLGVQNFQSGVVLLRYGEK